MIASSLTYANQDVAMRKVWGVAEAFVARSGVVVASDANGIRFNGIAAARDVC